MKLTFTAVHEFLTELEHAAGARQVEQDILRVTCQYRGSEAPFQYVYVVAGYIEVQWTGTPQDVTHRRLVELRTYCGEHWGKGFEATTKTSRCATACIEQLKATAQALGLEVRAGLFEETPTT